MAEIASTTKKELLVVDDEVALCKTLSTMFEERGVTVATATTARAALEQVRRKHPDVVLLDLKLPDSSGFIVLSKLKAQFPDLRVIIISALSDEKTIQEALQRGASGYLPKPFDFERCFYTAMGIETVDLARLRPNPKALEHVPESVATTHHVLPIDWDGRTLQLVMPDPLDAAHCEELTALLGCAVTPLAAFGGDLAAAVRRSYAASAYSPLTGGAPATEPTARPAAIPPEIIQLVEHLIQDAHANRATDLHIGIGPNGPWLHERVDGVLRDVPVIPLLRSAYVQVVMRVKALARLDTATRGVPQQGQMQFPLATTTLDLRVSVLPTACGEHLAIRLLEPSLLLPLTQLGLMEEQLSQIKALMAKPAGLLLVTGPDRSGKSNSLYALLSTLNTGHANIVTVEEHVEHLLPGLTQMPLQASAELTFASGLRAALQHDPDVVMVSDLRDAQTAFLAVRTALTGHLVLGAMHTIDSSSAITRLFDFGIEPFFLCSTLSGIISQRLVRKLCTACRESSTVDASTLVPMGIEAPKGSGSVALWRAKGCAQCGNTGYHGRSALFEILVIDHHIRSLIIKRSPGAQIRQSAISRGMIPLSQSGWQKVQAGETSVEELLRVCGTEPH